MDAHNFAMLGCIGESLSLKSFSTHTLCLQLVFMRVRAENLLSHTVEVGSLHSLRLESLKLVFQPLHTFPVNKL